MASIRSNIASMRNCSGSMPPSSLIIEFRRKPVATIWSCVGIRQQVAGDLLDDELVVGQVAVERADDPVAIGPDKPRLVLFVAVASRRSGPRRARCGPSARRSGARRAAASTACTRRLALRLPSSRRSESVGGRPVRSSVRRRSSVSASAARRRREAFLLQPGEDEAVDVVLRPGRVLHLRHGRPDRRGERPVGLVLGPFGDPAAGAGPSRRRSATSSIRPAASARRRRSKRCGGPARSCPAGRARSPARRCRRPSAPARARPAAGRLRDARRRGRGRQNTCRPTAAGSAAGNRPCRRRA